MAIALFRNFKHFLVDQAIAPLKHTLLDAIYHDLDGVRSLPIDGQLSTPASTSHPETVHLNLSYLLPSFLYSLYLLDLLYLYLTRLPNEASATVDAVPMGNKMFPSQMAKEGGVLWAEALVMILAVTGQLLFHKMEPFDEKFRLFASTHQDGSLKEMKQNGKVIPAIEAGRIFKLHRKARKCTQLLYGILYVWAYLFFNVNIALNWTASVTDMKAILWIAVALPHVVLHNYIAVCCFIVNCRYLCIRQRTQMNRLGRLIAQSNRAQGRLVKRKAPQSLPHPISGYSAFWSRYLSVYFAGLTFLATYPAFLFLKISATSSLLVNLFIAYFCSLLFCLLLWITLECSVLVVNNKETLKLQRAFRVHTSLARKGIPLSAAIKFDHIEADSKSIGQIGFHLFDSVQVNSKMFEMLFVYISSLFMKIVEHEL